MCKFVQDGACLVDGQCDHLELSPLAPLPAGNRCSTAPSHNFSAGSFSPAEVVGGELYQGGGARKF